MIRQSQRLDTIKLYVHLIGKIKKGEEIDLSNRLLSTEFKNISNKQIKVMLEIESLHYQNITQEEIQEFTKNILAFRELTKVGSQDYKIFSLLLLKLHSVPIIKALNAKQAIDFTTIVQKFMPKIIDLQHYRYILQTLFHFKSILALQKADISKIQQKYNNRKQISHLLFIIALVKATISKQQATKILKRINYNPNILQEKKQIILFLAELSNKERELLTYRSEEENLVEKSFLTVESARTVIKNSIQNQCKIQINSQNQEQTFKKLNSNLDENLYLYAYPLVHIYYQKNPQIVESVKSTELYKYLTTSKSFLVENYSSTSQIIPNQYSKSKTQKKNKKNPANFITYYKANEQSNSKVCSLVCKNGLMFTKHNFGNLSSSNKFVQVTPQAIEYHKSSDLSGSSTRWQMNEVMGILYGKMTARQLQNDQAQPQHCFSFILSDRTFDLSVETKERIPEMHSFIRGASALINQYHQNQKTIFEQKLARMTETKKQKVKELNERICFHDGKITKWTKGRLLWSQMILFLNKKVSFDPQKGKTYLKLQGIKKINNKIQKK